MRVLISLQSPGYQLGRLFTDVDAALARLRLVWRFRKGGLLGKLRAFNWPDDQRRYVLFGCKTPVTRDLRGRVVYCADSLHLNGVAG